MIPSLYDNVEGVWLDEFLGDWITSDILDQHVDKGKKICIVSPDLHKRDYLERWKEYKKIDNLSVNKQISICTDFPELAKKYFNEKN